MARNNLFPSIGISAATVIALLITQWIRAEYIYRELSCRRYPKSMHDERRLHYSSPSSSPATPSCLNDIYNQCEHISHPSHSFVEVSRRSIPFIVLKDCLLRRGMQAHPWIQEILLRFGWFEGYSEGYPNMECSDCMDEDHKRVKVPYGCWFNHALGSGIYVDVGKTLTGTVSRLLEELGLHPTTGCLLDGLNRTYDGGLNCIDKYYCSRALALGYDSIQIVDRQEIIICSGMCATHRFDGACPPVRLYRRTHNAHEESSNDSSKIHGVKPSPGHAAVANDDGDGSSYRYEDCRCDDSGDVMNCDNDIYTFHHIHHGKSCEKIIIASSSIEESIPPIEPSKAFNLTLFFGSRLLTISST